MLNSHRTRAPACRTVNSHLSNGTLHSRRCLIRPPTRMCQSSRFAILCGPLPPFLYTCALLLSIHPSSLHSTGNRWRNDTRAQLYSVAYACMTHLRRRSVVCKRVTTLCPSDFLAAARALTCSAHTRRISHALRSPTHTTIANQTLLPRTSASAENSQAHYCNAAAVASIFILRRALAADRLIINVPSIAHHTSIECPSSNTAAQRHLPSHTL